MPVAMLLLRVAASATGAAKECEMESKVVLRGLLLAPVLIGFLAGSLPVLLPLLLYRGLAAQRTDLSLR